MKKINTIIFDFGGVFIDDNSSNVFGGQKAKINAIYYKNSKQMVEELKKYGVKI